MARNERLDELLRTELLLSLQRALVGAVPASLRAVTCDWGETKVTLRYIFDGPVDPYDAVDHPAGLAPHFLRAWAYMRKEGPTGDVRLLLAGAGG